MKKQTFFTNQFTFIKLVFLLSFMALLSCQKDETTITSAAPLKNESPQVEIKPNSIVDEREECECCGSCTINYTLTWTTNTHPGLIEFRIEGNHTGCDSSYARVTLPANSNSLTGSVILHACLSNHMRITNLSTYFNVNYDLTFSCIPHYNKTGTLGTVGGVIPPYWNAIGDFQCP